MSKYKAKKTIIDDITFDSKKEANRYIELKEQLDKGEISNLQMQVPYELIPKQMDGKKVVERACKYLADFQYVKDGQTIVEDVKSRFTKNDKIFSIKRKLMLYVYGIKVIIYDE